VPRARRPPPCPCGPAVGGALTRARDVPRTSSAAFSAVLRPMRRTSALPMTSLGARAHLVPTTRTVQLSSLPHPLHLQAQQRSSGTSPDNVSGNKLGCVGDSDTSTCDTRATKLSSVEQLDGGGQVSADDPSTLHVPPRHDADGARLGRCVRFRRAAGWRWASHRRRYRHVQEYWRSWELNPATDFYS